MKRVLGMLLAASLSAVGVLAAASPAQADASLTSVTLSTTTVVINGDAGCGDRAKVTIKVYDPLNEAWDVEATAYRPNGDMADYLAPAETSRSGGYVYYTDWINLCGAWSGDAPGKYRLHTEVHWSNNTDYQDHLIYKDTAFYVKRPTWLTYNASPEPAKKWTYLTHSGRLLFDPFGEGAYYGPKGIRINFEFKAAASTAYVYKGYVLTGAGGYYSKKLLTPGDGTWRAVYPYNYYRQSQLQYDYVDTY